MTSKASYIDDRYDEKEEKNVKVQITPDIDLDDIQPIDLQKSNKPEFLMLIQSDEYDNYSVINLKHNKHIASGSFGSVELYGNKTDGFVALKITDDDHEKKVVETFDISNCNLIGCRVIPVDDKSTSNYYYIAMTYCDGTLENIISEIHNDYDNKCKNKLITSIRDQIKCLFTKKIPLCYIDLKPGNLLFKCTNKKLRILVGDIGSIYNCNTGLGSSSFPYPFKYDKSVETLSKTHEQSVIWGLFMVLMLIYSKDFTQYDCIIDTFGWSNISKNSDVSELVKLCFKDSIYKNLFAKYAVTKNKHNFKGFQELLSNTLLQ